MYKAIIVFALFLSVSLQAQIKKLKSSRDFWGFYAKDTVQLKGLCDETMILQSISENAKGIKLSNPQAFFKIDWFYS
jgi:hypothetical protein